MDKKFVYADCAATTRISENVLNTMMPYLTDQFGNASSVYSIGRRARRAVETAREQAALTFGCNPSEIFFTSGGTESDNWALRCTYNKMKKCGKTHIITTAIEHPAVLNTCRILEKEGASVTYIPAEHDGTVNPELIEKAITSETALVSVMFANNETGIIQPVSKIGKICSDYSVLFHTDAVQAAAHNIINVRELNIDMLSVSGHKLGGPKGIGALYIKNSTGLSSFIYGGSQEKNMRAGTENVAAIVGFGQALADVFPELEKRNTYIRTLRNHLADGLTKIKGVSVNGDISKALPGHCSISVEGADGEALLLMLDLKGICASAGSACTSGNSEPSHVLTAMGISRENALSSVRFSLDHNNTSDDVEYIINTLRSVTEKLKKC